MVTLSGSESFGSYFRVGFPGGSGFAVNYKRVLKFTKKSVLF